MAFGIERAFTSCSRKAEGETFQSSRPFPRSRAFCGSMGGGGCCFFVSLGDLRITSPLPVRLQPVLDYFRESVRSEISAVDDSKPPVVELFPRDDLEGAAIGFALFVNRDRGSLDSERFVQPKLQDVTEALLHLSGCEQQHE